MRIIVVCLVLLAVNQVRAEDSPARAGAKSLKDLGSQAYDRGDYALALEHLTNAYNLYPSPKLRYNLGMVHLKLGHDAEALTHFEQFLATAPDADASIRSFAEKAIPELSAKTAHLSVSSDPPDASVSLDERFVGKTPLRLHMQAGDHLITVEKSGYRGTTQRVQGERGQERDVALRLVALPQPTARRTLAIGLGAGLGGAAAVALGLGLGLGLGLRAEPSTTTLGTHVVTR